MNETVDAALAARVAQDKLPDVHTWVQKDGSGFFQVMDRVGAGHPEWFLEADLDVVGVIPGFSLTGRVPVHTDSQIS